MRIQQTAPRLPTARPRRRPRHLTLQRITLVLAVPGITGTVTACRVSGARYVVCFPRVGRRARFVTVSRTVLVAGLAHGLRIVGRV